ERPLAQGGPAVGGDCDLPGGGGLDSGGLVFAVSGMRKHQDLLDQPLPPYRSYPVFLLCLVAGYLLWLVSVGLSWFWPVLTSSERFVASVQPAAWVYVLAHLSVWLIATGLVGDWRKRREKTWWHKVLLVVAVIILVLYLLEQILVTYVTFFGQL
ncbi:MAG: hypothetical protein AAFZ52_17040, partial [Bacteroidota bacterium]